MTYFYQHHEEVEIAMSNAMSDMLRTRPENPVTFCARLMIAQVRLS